MDASFKSLIVVLFVVGRCCGCEEIGTSDIVEVHFVPPLCYRDIRSILSGYAAWEGAATPVIAP